MSIRKSEFNHLDPMFLERWSPRSFKTDKIEPRDLLCIFEAARWAPSCFNEQPWVFVYAVSDKDRKKFLEVLVEGNRGWAATAPVLVGVFSKRRFAHENSQNHWADFDCGAAWMSISLQANKLGYHCHAMAGYDKQKAYSTCKVNPDNYNVICMMTIGRKEDPENIEERFRAREQPNTRNPLKDMIFEGHFEE